MNFWKTSGSLILMNGLKVARANTEDDAKFIVKELNQGDNDGATVIKLRSEIASLKKQIETREIRL